MLQIVIWSNMTKDRGKSWLLRLEILDLELKAQA